MLLTASPSTKKYLYGIVPYSLAINLLILLKSYFNLFERWQLGGPYGLEPGFIPIASPISSPISYFLGGFLAYPIIAILIAIPISYIGSKYFNKPYTLLGTTKKTLKFFLIVWSIFTIVAFIELNTIDDIEKMYMK